MTEFSAPTPSHLIARRQQEDAARAERRAREDALIRQYHRAENAKAKLEARRDTDLAKLEQRMRSIRGTAAAKIAEVKKEVARVVADLKTDHTAEEAAPLLALTVDQYNNILYNGHARTTPCSGPTLPTRIRPRPATQPTPRRQLQRRRPWD